MKRLVFYFEVNGLAEDEDGIPCLSGAKVDFGYVPDEKYDGIIKEAKKCLDVYELLMLKFRINTPDHYIRPISMEEYKEKYGDD